MFLPAKVMTFCEAFPADDFDVDGSIEDFWHLVQYLYTGHLGQTVLSRKNVERCLAALPAGRTAAAAPYVRGRLHSRERDAQAIASHYDVSNEFYALWLDSHMVYTCAYFGTRTTTSRRPRRGSWTTSAANCASSPASGLLDIGCGWGGLAMYAAEHYGVEASA